MKLKSFLAVSILLAILLALFPYREDRVAKLRLERIWTVEGAEAFDPVQRNCDKLLVTKENPFSSLFLNWLIPQPIESEGRVCKMELESAKLDRFHLLSRWAVGLNITDPKGNLLVQQKFQFDTPKPLVLFPIFLYILSLFFQIPLNFRYVLVSYFLMLSGGNLIQALAKVPGIIALTFSSEDAFIGLSLIIIWIARQLAIIERQPKSRTESTPHEAWGNRMVSAITGLWNPLVFTLMGRYLVVRRTINAFLDWQVVLTALSLYLLSFYLATPKEAILFPRYFTFAILILFFMKAWMGPTQKYNVFWKLPHLKRGVIAIAVIEGLHYFYPYLRGISLINRMGLALIFSEIIYPVGPWKSVFKIATPWVGILFLSYFLSSLSVSSGVIDLVLVAMDPRMHPNYLTFWTFLVGGLLGFVSGGFSLVFFTLLTYMKMPKVPLINAALIDGVLLGCLLSPFSPYNLLPVIQFKMKPRELLWLRLKELTEPIILGGTIYAVATFSSVALLQPVTFIFGVLVVFALKLREQNWLIRPKSFT